MLPIDGEFITLYCTYLILCISLIIGLVKLKNKTEITFHSVVYTLYLSYMIYIFSDSDNFGGGGGLVVLGLGGLFLVIHLAIFIIYKIFKHLNNNVK